MARRSAPTARTRRGDEVTGRTHQIAAFGAVSLLVLVGLREAPAGATSLAMAATALVGGLAPDLDKPGSALWRQVPAGGVLARLVHPIFVGGHRHLSHSLLGLILAGLAARWLLSFVPAAPDMASDPIWWAFLAGYASHLLADSLNPEGVPWGFPIPRFWGFPPHPLGFLRVPTGGRVERWLVGPALLVAIAALYYAHAARLIPRL